MSSNEDLHVADPLEFLQIKLNADGTLTRFAERLAASTPAESDPPRERGIKKLPLVVYFHGGGFVFCSAASTIFHRFHHDLASGLPAVIASRLYDLNIWYHKKTCVNITLFDLVDDFIPFNKQTHHR